MSIAGIVLAGGKSSRYGQPKMFETYNKKSFYEYSIDALKENYVTPILVSTNLDLLPYFQRKDVAFAVEKCPYQGPLYAIHHALTAIDCDAEWFFILSCDIPFINAEFVHHMVTLTQTDSPDIVLPVQPDHIHPLLALYHRRTLPLIEQLVTQGERRLTGLLNQANVLRVPFSAEDPTFINVNHRSDWHV
ncbi:molybdenum cofactor guanylyltransferase [Priestia aryabhattai]|uniref:molybdenum cofactor guanylyltransferase n=1 Tax=Priestia aryabhattai TaxID=412384 RepID=UPI000B433E44|nr:molybdenum cofactor guanylyltransferase [Priestia aryabhattai]MBZ6484460.1 molybdenum cofactor guanylyltransferase [Priestia aryabhattai]MDH3112046.1 molybdenum cofactor guanylyltransferase [Priestia aryabhattai]MDH3129039.1 molybdenum cofactor guanylyltransferase [Priestia aryabhattai]MDH3130758.1 molybdenum cofactor guanylyltransferase [Priestia aryabhattai]MED4155335.1 molybdenum cofactor guanylyltransferase [Priestia aryabhattai]